MRQQGKLDEATVKYQEVLAIKPENEFALMGYAAVLMGQSKYDEASDLYLNLLNRDADNMLILNCFKIALSEDESQETITPFVLYVP